jgi:hypothetical protein
LTVIETETYTGYVNHQRRLASLFVLVGVVFAVPSTTRAQTPQRVILASVLDASGAPVMAVEPSDLVVREDDVRREVLRVSLADDPMQVVLLVDDSQAADPYFRDYRVALPLFIDEVLGMATSGGRNQIAIVGVGSRPTIITDYTSNQAELLKGVERIFPQSDSASYLLQGIIEVSEGIIRRETRRPIIVALTTEGPEFSERHYDRVLEALAESGAALHVISLGRSSNGDHDRAIVLSRGTSDTGGRYDTLFTGSALRGRLTQLAVELTHQYRVTYASPDRLIPPERVTIAPGRPELTVRGMVMAEDR